MAHHRDADEIPVLRPLLPTAERLLPYLSRIDASRCYTNWGPLASELEERLADRLGIDGHSVVSACSGTMALVGAILATAGRARPDRPYAILPALTFVATAIAVEQCGYHVHLVDVASDDWILDAGALHAHPLLGQTGVVVPVSAYGRPVAHEPLAGIPTADRHPGGHRRRRELRSDLVGSQGGLLSELPVALSFHATKAFASGEGGCVITTDARLAASVTRSSELRVLRGPREPLRQHEREDVGVSRRRGAGRTRRVADEASRLPRSGRYVQDADARGRARGSTRRRAGAWPPATSSIEARTPTRPPASRRH